MTYQVQILKGLFQPRTNRYQLEQAEGITRFGTKLLLLYLFSAIIFLLGAYYGIGSESMSKEITKLGESEYEAGKLLVIAGKLVAGPSVPNLLCCVGCCCLLGCFRYPIQENCSCSNDCLCFALARKGTVHTISFADGFKPKC